MDDVETFLDVCYGFLCECFPDKRHLTVKYFKIFNKEYDDESVARACCQVYISNRKYILKDAHKWLVNNVVNIQQGGGCVQLSVLYNKAVKMNLHNTNSLLTSFLQIINNYDPIYETELCTILNPMVACLKEAYKEKEDDFYRSRAALQPPDGVVLRKEYMNKIEAYQEGFTKADKLMSSIN